MDSDDEYNSGLSSQEGDFEEMMQDSEVDSLDEGYFLLNPCCYAADLTDSARAADLEDEEPDMGFSQDKDTMKPRKKAYEVDYQIHGPDDILFQQAKQIDEVSAILGQPSEAAAILLRHLRWNKERLIEKYMDSPDALLEDAGLGPDGGKHPAIERLHGFTCNICFDDDPGIETYAMKCEHRYCVDCYLHYLTQKVKAEGEAARIQCPTEGCNRIVDSKSFALLTTHELKERSVAPPSTSSHLSHLLTRVQIPGTLDPDICGRLGQPQMVPGSQLRVRS